MPTITAVTRKQTTNTISFTTVSGWTYSLLATNKLTAPQIHLAGRSGSSSSTGTLQSLKDVTTSGSRFYLIKASN
jgi:hypothetical protein